MFEISKEFAFSASHQLHGLREGHPCGRLHGHNYLVKVTLTGQALDEHGFLLDYGDLKPIGQWIDDTLDHRHLNDVPGVNLLPNPTAEHLAGMMASAVRKLVAVPAGVSVAVSISETPKTWATFRSEAAA